MPCSTCVTDKWGQLFLLADEPTASNAEARTATPRIANNKLTCSIMHKQPKQDKKASQPVYTVD